MLNHPDWQCSCVSKVALTAGKGQFVLWLLHRNQLWCKLLLQIWSRIFWRIAIIQYARWKNLTELCDWYLLLLGSICPQLILCAGVTSGIFLPYPFPWFSVENGSFFTVWNQKLFKQDRHGQELQSYLFLQIFVYRQICMYVLNLRKIRSLTAELLAPQCARWLWASRI